MIIHDDILNWAKEYKGPKFHGMLLDPPYHLTPQFNRFSKTNSKPPKEGVFRRQAKGFMQTTWDGGDLAFRPETWAALGEHLYPGGFGLAFASPRTQHRIACAIEDAGLIIQPTIYLWGYLSGFPKATRVKDNGADVPGFEGHRYGGQALKPSVEPLILWQRPYAGRPVENIVETGAGALWVDGGRIATGDDRSRQPGQINGNATYDLSSRTEVNESHPNGRWPSNLILTCDCDLIDWCDCDDDCEAR